MMKTMMKTHRVFEGLPSGQRLTMENHHAING